MAGPAGMSGSSLVGTAPIARLHRGVTPGLDGHAGPRVLPAY